MFRKQFVLLVFCILLLCLGACDDRSGTTTDGSCESKIAFESIPGDEIFVMNSDGGNKTRLSEDGFSPSWSPDGNKISFVSSRDGNWEIYVVDADGNNQTRLTENNVDDRSPSWSPDGSTIVFTSDIDGDYEIYVMDADGSNKIRLTENDVDDFYPSFSPDGSKISYISDESGGLYVMDADGSNQINLSSQVNQYDPPSWSPNGEKIAFLSVESWNIHVLDIEGNDRMILPGGYYPEWSPDGEKIAYTIYEDEVWIFVMDADGNNQTPLAQMGILIDPFILPQPSWSPDGDSIVYFAWPDIEMGIDEMVMDIYLIDIGEKNITQLTDNEALNMNPIWSPCLSNSE